MAETTLMEPELHARIASWVPQGYDLSNARLVDVVGTIDTPSLEEVAALRVLAQEQKGARFASIVEMVARLAEVETAGPSMINSEGKPTVMKVQAWMVHAGFPNLNGDAFVKEELESVAPALFKAPNFGVMDWNHSAVLRWNDDPPLIGIWYDAQFGFNSKANDGKGAHGIQVTGMVFSWLFPEQANEMLADQARDGFVRFSMACIPQSLEFAKVNGQYSAILHNPVFFTNSALNRPNADPQANGVVTEQVDVTPVDLKQKLTNLATTVTIELSPDTKRLLEATATITQPTLKAAARTTTEEQVMTAEEIMNELKSGKETAERLVTELSTKVTAADTTITTLKTENEKLAGEKTAAETAKGEFETKLGEVTTAKEALAEELKAAQKVAEDLTAEITALKAKIEEFEKAEATKVAKELLIARLTELPEAYAEAHKKRAPENREKIEAGWASLSTEEWDLKKEELFGGLTITTKVGFVERSKDGTIPTGQAEATLKAQIAALLK